MPSKQVHSENPISNSGNPSIYDHKNSIAYLFTYSYLTFNTITTIYRAYINNDKPMVAFVIFVYFGYLILDYCFTTYNQLLSSDQESSWPKKQFLKITICSLTSAILFGFGYTFSTFMSMVVVVPMYGMALLTSVFLFYVYFIYDHQNERCDGESKLIGDKNSEHGVSPLQIV